MPTSRLFTSIAFLKTPTATTPPPKLADKFIGEEKQPDALVSWDIKGSTGVTAG